MLVDVRPGTRFRRDGTIWVVTETRMERPGEHPGDCGPLRRKCKIRKVGVTPEVTEEIFTHWISDCAAAGSLTILPHCEVPHV